MGWTYKHRKMRDKLRKRFTDETGSTDYTSPEFAAWVDRLLSEQ